MIYYAKNIAGGSNTVTVRFNQAAAYPDVRILEYCGSGPEQPAGSGGSGDRIGDDGQQRLGHDDVSQRADLCLGDDGNDVQRGGVGVHEPQNRCVRQHRGRQDGDQHGQLQRHGDDSSSVWVMQILTFRSSGQGPPPPTVTSISPTSGTTAGGTSVTITGTGFASGASVIFGTTAATNVVVVSSTSITADAPAHAAGAVNVVVTNTDSQSGTLPSGYTYNSANPPPTVVSIAPTSGTTAGGTSVTITGTGFLAGANVTFGTTAATSVRGCQLHLNYGDAPAHAAGAVNVVVTNTDSQSGTLPSGYTYNSANPPPTVVSIAPTSGTTAGGTSSPSLARGFWQEQASLLARLRQLTSSLLAPLQSLPMLRPMRLVQ